MLILMNAKTMRWGRLARAGILTLLAAQAARGADEAYAIKLERPLKADVTYILNATHTERASDKSDFAGSAATSVSNFRQVALEAELRVDKMDAAGRPAVETLVIRKLTVQTSTAEAQGWPSRPKSLLDPGTEIQLYMQDNGQPAFALKKAGTLSDEATLALQQGCTPWPLSEDAYGTGEPKKIGATWPVNREAIGGAKTNPQYVDPSRIDGTVTLKELQTIAGVPCVNVRAQVTVKDFPVAGIAPKEATRTTKIAASLPMDPAKPAVAWSLHVTWHVLTEEKPLGQRILRHVMDSDVLHEATLAPR